MTEGGVIIFYSGNGGSRANPENTLGAAANLMLTYQSFYKAGRPDRRFSRVVKARKTGKPVAVHNRRGRDE